MLDRIPEHRAWHAGCICIQKLTEFCLTHALADFSEHPSTRLVHEIVWVIQEVRNQEKCERFISFFDLIKTRDHDDAIGPEMRTLDTIRDKARSLLVCEVFFQIGPDDVLRRDVHEIPTIDTIHMFHVKIRNRIDRKYLVFRPLGQGHHSCKPFFVVSRGYQCLHLSKSKRLDVRLQGFSDSWYGDAQKLISFAILSDPSLKKPCQCASLVGTSEGA